MYTKKLVKICDAKYIEVVNEGGVSIATLDTDDDADRYIHLLERCDKLQGALSILEKLGIEAPGDIECVSDWEHSIYEFRASVMRESKASKPKSPEVRVLKEGHTQPKPVRPPVEYVNEGDKPPRAK